jgi:CHASE3 domain sensor protein
MEIWNSSYRWSTGWFKIMSKLDQPRLANATPEYSQQQLDQIIRTLEQMVLQLNNTFTQDVQDANEAQAWYFIRV